MRLITASLSARTAGRARSWSLSFLDRAGRASYDDLCYLFPSQLFTRDAQVLPGMVNKYVDLSCKELLTKAEGRPARFDLVIHSSSSESGMKSRVC
jgi:hypothetical protein